MIKKLRLKKNLGSLKILYLIPYSVITAILLIYHFIFLYHVGLPTIECLVFIPYFNVV